MAMCSELVLGASHTAAADGHKQRRNGFPHLRQLSSRTWDSRNEGPGCGRNDSVDIKTEIQGSV